jgi:hypothetical protein
VKIRKASEKRVPFDKLTRIFVVFPASTPDAETNHEPPSISDEFARKTKV